MFDQIRSFREKRRCYAAAIRRCDVVQEELGELLGGFPAMAVGFVFKKIRTEIAGTKSDLVKSVNRGLTYEQIVWLLMSNVTWDELTGGKHMIYRNTPSMLGQGLVGLFVLSSDALVACEYQTQS